MQQRHYKKCHLNNNDKSNDKNKNVNDISSRINNKKKERKKNRRRGSERRIRRGSKRRRRRRTRRLIQSSSRVCVIPPTTRVFRREWRSSTTTRRCWRAFDVRWDENTHFIGFYLSISLNAHGYYFSYIMRSFLSHSRVHLFQIYSLTLFLWFDFHKNILIEKSHISFSLSLSPYCSPSVVLTS